MLATLRADNRTFWVLVGGVSAFLVVLFSVPFVRRLFSVGPVTVIELLACLGLAIASIAWFDVVKRRVLHRRGAA